MVLDGENMLRRPSGVELEEILDLVQGEDAEDIKAMVREARDRVGIFTTGAGAPENLAQVLEAGLGACFGETGNVEGDSSLAGAGELRCPLQGVLVIIKGQVDMEQVSAVADVAAEGVPEDLELLISVVGGHAGAEALCLIF